MCIRDRCGTTTKTVKIAKVSKIKLSKTKYTYNGKKQTPSVTVKDSKGKELKVNTDYKVKLPSGRKNVGTYEVKIDVYKRQVHRNCGTMCWISEENGYLLHIM